MSAKKYDGSDWNGKKLCVRQAKKYGVDVYNIKVAGLVEFNCIKKKK